MRVRRVGIKFRYRSTVYRVRYGVRCSDTVKSNATPTVYGVRYVPVAGTALYPEPDTVCKGGAQVV